MKRWYHIVIALAVLIGLAVFLNEDIRKEQTSEIEEEKESLFFKVDWTKPERFIIATTFVEVEFQPSDDLANKESEDRSWTMVKPLQTDPDEGDVRNFLRTMKTLKVKRTFEDVTNLEVYGLDDASKPLKMSLLDKDGTTMVSAKIGGSNPGQDGNYALIEGDSNIYLVEKRLDYLANKDLKYFRNKSLLTNSEDDFDHVELVRHGNKPIVLDKKEGKWHLTEPLSVTADEENVGAFLSAIRNLRIDHFESENADAEAKVYGLDKPQLEIKLRRRIDTPTTEDQTEDTEQDATTEEQQNDSLPYDLHFIVGGFNDPNTAFYARKANAQSVYRIQKFHLTKLEKAYGDFVNLELGNFYTGSVKAIKAEGSFLPTPVTLTYGDNMVWQYVTGEKIYPGNFNKIEPIVKNLAGLRAESFLAKTPSELKLGKPEFSIHVDMATKNIESEKPIVYTFNFYRTKIKDQPTYIVQGGQDNFVFKITSGTYDSVRKNLESARENGVVPEGLEVTSITVSYKQKKLVAIKKDDVWSAQEQMGVEVTPEKIATISDAIAHLKGSEFVSNLKGAKEVFSATILAEPSAANSKVANVSIEFQALEKGSNKYISIKPYFGFESYSIKVSSGDVNTIVEELGLGEASEKSATENKS